MNLGLNEEQKLLKSSAEKYFLNNYSFEIRRKYVEGYLDKNELWKSLSDLGWLGLPLSSKHGGYGGSVSDVMVLMEAFGASLVTIPYVYFTILSGKIIEKLGSSKETLSVLSDISKGEAKISFAFAEPQNRYDSNKINTIAKKNDNNWLINGKKNFVVGAEECNKLLIPAYCKEDQEIKLFLFDKDNDSLIINSYQNIDSSSVADLNFDNFVINNNNLVSSLKEEDYYKTIEYLLDYATLANCSEALGIINKMYDLTLEYVKTREQFGKKIGKFQVIQHRMVDLFIKKEEMRSLNYMAQVHMSESSIYRKKKISLNKIFLGTHAKNFGQDCIQLHGGMGVADEMQIGHYFKRLTSLNTIFGNADYHYKRYAGI